MHAVRSLARSPVASTSKFTLEHFARRSLRTQADKQRQSTKAPVVQGWRAWFTWHQRSGPAAHVLAFPTHPAAPKKERIQLRIASLSDVELLERIQSPRKPARGSYLWLLLGRLEESGRLADLTDDDATSLFRRLTPSVRPRTLGGVEDCNEALLHRFTFVLDLLQARRLPLGPDQLKAIAHAFQQCRSAPAALQIFSRLRMQGTLDELDAAAVGQVYGCLLQTISGWLSTQTSAGVLTRADSRRMQQAAQAIMQQIDERQLPAYNARAVMLSILRIVGNHKGFAQYARDAFHMDLSLPAPQDATVPEEARLTSRALNTVILRFRDQKNVSGAIAAFETNAYQGHEAGRAPRFEFTRLSSPIFTNLLQMAFSSRSPLLLAHYFEQTVLASIANLKSRQHDFREAVKGGHPAGRPYRLHGPKVVLQPLHVRLRQSTTVFPPREAQVRQLAAQLSDWHSALVEHRQAVSELEVLAGARPDCQIENLVEYTDWIEHRIREASIYVASVEATLVQLAKAKRERNRIQTVLSQLAPDEREAVRSAMTGITSRDDRLQAWKQGRKLLRAAAKQGRKLLRVAAADGASQEAADVSTAKEHAPTPVHQQVPAERPDHAQAEADGGRMLLAMA